ncbi:MAG: hypothetical protein BroJett039_03700 [Chloroflexota bacterium]|nr:MAG: hypothetical protein BroJett039_03700 [Chloroflexota bacterium]
MKSSQPLSKETKLYQVAERQDGYFTSSQAQQAGYTRPLLGHHVKAGRFLRVKHGIYRLVQFPESPRADLWVAFLQLKGRGVLSHETALALYELTDLLPSAIHLTIPPQLSRRHAGLRLHTNRLARHETIQRDGFVITTVERTLADVITNGIADQDARLAISQTLARGMVTQAALTRYAKKRGGRMAQLVAAVLSENVVK